MHNQTFPTLPGYGCHNLYSLDHHPRSVLAFFFHCVTVAKAYTLLHWSYPRDMKRLRAKQAAAEAAEAAC